MKTTGHKQFTAESLKTFLEKNRVRLEYDSWVSVEKNFFYINVPKTGCTKIKKMLQAVCGLPVPAGVSPIHRRENGPFVKSIYSCSIEEQLYLFNSDEVSRICFVRNPYTRILSGYWNKVAGPKKLPKINDRIFNFLAEKNNQKVASFMEFIKYLLRQDKTVVDLHFRPQSLVCHFDKINYNQIGNFENMDKSLIRIFSKLGAQANVLESVKVKENTSIQNTSLNSLLLVDLKSSDLNNDFYSFFKKDFLNFGYSKIK